MNLNDREERQIAAADYVLGRLDPDDRVTFEERLPSDASLRATVDEWRVRLSTVLEDGLMVASTPTADAALQPPERPAAAGGPEQHQVPEPSPHREQGVLADTILLVQLQRRLETWRMLAFAGAITAAGFGFFLFARSPVWQPERGPGTPTAGSLRIQPTTEAVPGVPLAGQPSATE